MNHAHTEMNKWVLEDTIIRENSMILDVGCGGGKTIQLLSKMNTCKKIYGIDYSEQAVRNSLRVNTIGIATGKVHIQQASVTDIPFPDNYFDIITAFQTHYFWSDLETCVNEVFRVLNSGGCFLIAAELYKINYHMKSYKTKKEMELLLKKAGFAEVHIIENANKKWICMKGIKKQPLV